MGNATKLLGLITQLEKTRGSVDVNTVYSFARSKYGWHIDKTKPILIELFRRNEIEWNDSAEIRRNVR